MIGSNALNLEKKNKVKYQFFHAGIDPIQVPALVSILAIFEPICPPLSKHNKPVLLGLASTVGTFLVAMGKPAYCLLQSRITFKVRLLTYNGLNNQAPSYLYDPIVPYHPIKNLHSHIAGLLAVPRVFKSRMGAFRPLFCGINFQFGTGR